MENNLTRTLYNSCPVPVKSLFASAFGYLKNQRRFSGDYDSWFQYFTENSTKDSTELVELQNERLHQFIVEAVSKVEYYQQCFKKNHISCKDIKTVSDLIKVPILEKELVKANTRDFLNPGYRHKILWTPTSGSTGKPMLVPLTREAEQMEWAFLWSRGRTGVTLKDKYSSFTGLVIVSPNKRRPPFWVTNWSNRQRLFSIWNMNDENMFKYFETLSGGYNEYLSGYASGVYQLANFMLDNGLKLSSAPKGFFNGSEELQPMYRTTIEKAFECKAWDHYGQVELAGSITQYACGHLHYDMDYSILEFDEISKNNDGSIIAEILATNFNNYAWPLLRYKTGDLVEHHPDDRCLLGFPGKVIRRIYGRTGQFLILPDGRKVSNISLIPKKCIDIRFMQVVQVERGKLILNVVTEEQYNELSEKTLLHEFRKKVGDEVEINVQHVKEIQRTRSGKHLSIIRDMV